MKKMISFLTVLVLSIVTMLPVKVMAAEYPHRNSDTRAATPGCIKFGDTIAFAASKKIPL